MDEHLELYLALQAVGRWFSHDPGCTEVFNLVTVTLRRAEAKLSTGVSK